MKFQDYLIESWKDYKVSNSPKVLLYDFYLLSYLSSLILDPGTRKDVGLTGVGYSGKFFGREGQELDEDIQNAQRKLLPFLGNKLSQALFLAICAELRHALDRNQKWDKFKHTNNKTFKNYIRNLKLMSDNELKAFQSKRNIETPELEVSSKGYKTSYQAAKKAITETGGNVVTFARMAADAFNDLNWSSSFGGEKWAEIAKGYVDLRIAINNYNPEAPSPSSESAEKLIAAIDHAFDLEHNTGTVLNKVKYFSIGGDYGWIETALDDKKDADMYSIAGKASSDMRKLGLEVLKVAGMQDKQLKKVPAEAGIPTKKIKLSGFTSGKNKSKNIKDLSSLPIGSLITDEYNEFVGKVIKSDINITVKYIAVKNQQDKKWLGKNQKYNFNVAKSFSLVNKQDEANLLKDYFVDPKYKPEVTSTTSKFQVGDIVKIKNIGGVFGEIIAFNQTPGANLYSVKITSSNVSYLKAGNMLYNQHERELEQTNEKNEPAEELQLGDEVKVTNQDIYGTVVFINKDMMGIVVQIEVTKAHHEDLVGIKTWYPEKLLEKMDKPNVVKLQGFGGKKPAKIDPLSLSTRIDMPFMLTIGSILIHTRSSDLYIVQMVNGPEDYIKIKLVASNDAVDISNNNEPVFFNGSTIAEDFRVIENEDKKEVFASYEFIDLSTASRKAAKAAKADELAPRERDENLKVNYYYVLNKETIVVMITGLPRGYVEYKVVAGDKKHRSMEGADSGMPRDMFIDSIDFALKPFDVANYIRQIKKKPGSR